MKLLRNYLFRTLLFVAAAMSIQSCSCSKEKSAEDKISELLSDDVVMAFSGDVSRLFDALDVTVTDGVPALPDYMKDILNAVASASDRKEFEQNLENLKGLGYTNIVGGVKVGLSPEMIIAFSVDNEDDFLKSMTSLVDDFSTGSAEGFSTVGDKYFEFLVKDNVGYIVFAGNDIAKGKKAAGVIENWNKAASDKPLAAWKKDYLTTPRVFNMTVSLEPVGALIPSAQKREMAEQLGGMVDADQLFSMTLGCYIDLEGQSAKAGLTAYDKDGKEIANPYTGKFDTELMKYAGENDFIGMSWAMNQAGMEMWQQSVDKAAKQIEDLGQGYDGAGLRMMSVYSAMMQQAVDVCADYVSDGGVFAAAGLSDNVDLLGNPTSPDNYHVVIAAALKPEKAQEAFTGVCDLLDAAFETTNGAVVRTDSEYVRSVSMETGYDYYTNSRTYVEINLYVKLEGNTLVVSNLEPVKHDKNNFVIDDFAGSTFTFQLSIPENYPLLKTLDINEGLTATLNVKGSTVTGDLTLKGLDGKLIPGLCQQILDLSF